MKSKALKGIPNLPWWQDSVVGDWLHSAGYALFRRPWKTITKLYGWQTHVFKNDYDFDGHSMFAILEYKLQRIQKELINGHAVQEDEDLHALALAIKLAGRLKEDKYELVVHRRHDAKWGELITWMEPIPNSTNKYWRCRREHAVTDDQKTQERAEAVAGYDAASKRMERETRWFYGILGKYQRRWWD